MKQSAIQTINEMAIQLKHNRESMSDMIVNSNTINFQSALDRETTIDMGNQTYKTNNFAELQLSTKLGIPNNYYKRVKEVCPELLNVNMNYWLQTQAKPTMVRTLDGTARAFLSDRFKRVDNAPIFDMIEESIEDKGVNLISSAITDKRMYMKFTSPKLEGEVAVGDPIQMGITISNSEVGAGALEVRSMIYRLVCDNGMVSPQDYGESIRRTHRGAVQPLGVLYEEDTVMIESQAMSLKIRDTINQLLSPENFQKHLQAFKDAKEAKIEGNVPEVIRSLGRTLGFNKEYDDPIIRNLVQGGELNKYGLLNSLTAYAQDKDLSYDQASELEIMGGKILTMNPRQWNTIANAA